LVLEPAAANTGTSDAVGDREAVGDGVKGAVAEVVDEAVDVSEGVGDTLALGVLEDVGGGEAVDDADGVSEPVGDADGVSEPVSEPEGVNEPVSEPEGVNDAVIVTVAVPVPVAIAVAVGVGVGGQHSAAVPARIQWHIGNSDIDTRVKVAGPHVSTSVAVRGHPP